MNRQPAVHGAVVEHLRDGFVRWRAVCPCGWARRPRVGSGKEGAEHLAALHNRINRVQPPSDGAA